MARITSSQSEDPATAIRQVRDALASGALGGADLTARRISAFLGKTTSVLYHHWGSLDGFLHQVGQSGFERFAERIGGGLSQRLDPMGVAEAFVAFGLDEPALYHVMFERLYDWDALRVRGTFDGDTPGKRALGAVVALLRGHGSDDPELDAKVLWAGLHGLVSLALSGRANVGAPDHTDRSVALRAARRLAARLCPTRPPDSPEGASA